MKYPLVKCPLLFAAAIVSAGPAASDVFDYTGPTAMDGMTGWLGNDVWFAEVSEETNGPDELFGQPTGVTSNTIDFGPKGFTAFAESGDTDIAQSQLSFMVIARPDRFIEELVFTESGDTTLIALGADTAISSVTGNFFIDVVEVDGVLLNDIVNIAASMTYTPSNGLFEAGGTEPWILDTSWFGTLNVDLEQALIDNGIAFDFGVTKLNVTLNNNLVAGTTGSATSSISKKDFDGLAVTALVPEPGSLALLALGTWLVIGRRRRS